MNKTNIVQQENIRLLLEKVKAGTASSKECDELAILIRSSDDPGTIDYCNHVLAGDATATGLSTADPEWKMLFDNILLADVPAEPVTVRRISSARGWWAAAAAAVLILGAGTYFWMFSTKDTGSSSMVVAATDIQPGKAGAILTLANGSQVMLDSMGNGVVAKQNGAQAVLGNGQLSYHIDENTATEVAFNIMTTPKGRQFRLLLPDGTQVWLNAASSIRYPTVFTGSERRVEITGEAYFEVAQHAEKPFYVSVQNRSEVEVLGTNFNVNAYDNEESINTTLLDGAVRVTTSTPSVAPVVLKPGQQAQVNSNIKVIAHADVEKVMAWKNGLFNFENASLPEVMRQLERWYDIDVVYEGDVPNVELMGKMTKDVSLNGLLVVLKELGVSCKLEGRKLIVLQ